MKPSLDDLRNYLDASPSPYHAVASAAALLDAAGFVAVPDSEPWDQLPDLGYVVRDGALIAWRVPDGATGTTPFRLAGAHTDSPNLRIKPNPQRRQVGWEQLNVEVYGGILNNTWLDRDLGVAGRISAASGEHALVDVARPIARVPQLAVHLDRGVNDNGLKLDRQDHLRPVWATAGGVGGFAEWIADEAGVDFMPEFWELGLYDVQGAAVLGADESLLASGRLDNLLSCWAAVTALIGSAPTDRVAMIVLNDHEEVGSSSTTGAGGPMLDRTLERHVLGRGGDRSAYLAALAGSMCVSADNAHAIHPNYAEYHDDQHAPLINRGPAIKVNVSQRYATTSATAAAFAAACNAADVPYQTFVSRNNLPCGSTIGPVTATRLGIDTLDVGVPQLSMHSARELCGAEDPIHLTNALREYLGSRRIRTT